MVHRLIISILRRGSVLGLPSHKGVLYATRRRSLILTLPGAPAKHSSIIRRRGMHRSRWTASKIIDFFHQHIHEPPTPEEENHQQDNENEKQNTAARRHRHSSYQLRDASHDENKGSCFAEQTVFSSVSVCVLRCQQRRPGPRLCDFQVLAQESPARISATVQTGRYSAQAGCRC